MRLTLRTMLAYLDGRILDAKEAKELGEKIEKSDFANGLVHRIKNSLKRPKLGVPNLEGRGLGLDPNTVAEYLEDLLPPDRVPDFERVCLDSDVQLAEVAATHQILTWVEDKPAEIDEELRQRMYLIGAPDTKRQSAKAAAVAAPPVAAPPEQAGPPKTESITAAVAPPTTTGDTSPAKRKIEVPDYLQAGQGSKWKPILITLALAFLVSVIGLRLMGPFDSTHPLFGGGSGEVVQNPAPATPGSGTTTPADGGTTPANSGSNTATSSGTAKPETSPATEAKPDSSKPAATTPSVESPAEPAQPSEPGKPADEPKNATEPGTNPSAEPTEKPATKPAANPAAESGKPGTEPAVTPAEPSEPAPVAEPPVEVGHVKRSEGHFLVRREPGGRDWSRLPALTKLASGDLLKALPTYRPEIVLTPGVQVKLVGPTDATLLRPRDPAEPAIMLPYGRALLATAGVPGARIRLDFDGVGGMVTFADAATEVAVEVGRFLRPGANPEVEPALVVIHMLPTLGRVTWQADGSELAVPLAAGQVHAIVGNRAQTLAVAEPPAWLGAESLSEIDRLASHALEPSVAEGKSASLSLQERTQDRKSELRSLAARCLAFLDSYDALIDEFGDERQKSYWPAEFSSLLESVSRNPQSAARVRETLERIAGVNAPTLDRMLWGYSPQQLLDGDAQSLVGYLNHDEQKIRVFAFENLHRITGKTLSYRPEFNASRRKAAVQDWTQRAESGEIIYETLPTPSPFGG